MIAFTIQQVEIGTNLATLLAVAIVAICAAVVSYRKAK